MRKGNEIFDEIFVTIDESLGWKKKETLDLWERRLSFEKIPQMEFSNKLKTVQVFLIILLVKSF